MFRHETLNRINKLKQAAAKQNKPISFAIFDPANITYLTNSTGASGLFIPEEGEAILFASAVNCEYLKSEVRDFDLQRLKLGEKLIDKLKKYISAEKISVDTLPIESWRRLSQVAGGEENLELINNLIRDLRKIKDEQEIKTIKEACKIADIGIRTAQEKIQAGLSDKELAAEVEYAMRKAGSEGVAFESIIVSGVCCAFPHGTSMNKIISKGDFVTVDIGAIKNFYRSDITRTFIVGKATDKQKKIYETVKLAHQKAYEAIKPQVSAKEVDYAGRQVIEKAGLGEFFVHNLGHGVGLEVHEYPVLSPNSRDILEVGNVVTDEPGVYIPGFGGVRIEDTVLVTEDGAEKLTEAPYASLS